MLQINNETYITTSQAADLTGYTESYIQNLARAGKLQATKIGKAWAICQRSILQYGKKQEPKPRQKKRQSVSLRLKAMQLGHKLRQSPDGRVMCTHCQESVTNIAKGNMRCKQ